MSINTPSQSINKLTFKDKIPSEDDLIAWMKAKLGAVVPEVELVAKAPLVRQILQLKRDSDVIILGHNYMEPVLFHTVTDFVGDSLELSRKASETTAETIIFCGVRFMAETAKILNPSRRVLLPARVAGCSLAASITAQDVRELRLLYPDTPVVTYINTYADVKAETDICCTSGNAAKIIASLPGDQVIFLPDEYLAKNLAKETGKRFIVPRYPPSKIKNNPNIAEITVTIDGRDDLISGCKDALGIESPEGDDHPQLKSVIGWHGKCEVHDQFTSADVKNARRQFPDAIILAHPECHPEVTELVDFTGSTSAMIAFIQGAPAKKKYILLTECSMGDNIAAENPEKEMIRFCSVRCPHMNEITLEDTLHAMLTGEQEIKLDPDIIQRARSSLDRMLELS
jgi:quinolinate synthase